MATTLRQISTRGARSGLRRETCLRAFGARSLVTPVAQEARLCTLPQRLCASSSAPTVGPVRNRTICTPQRQSVSASPRYYWARAGDEPEGSEEQGESEESKKKKLDNETRIALGKTISILKDRLPTILQQPLPSDILAPNISLHLFPSTHPHLPVANGKAAYKAALWTSPLAWNRLPIIGNVGIDVQSIRLQPGPLPFTPLRIGSLDEVLVVRWVTEPSTMPTEFLRTMAARISGGEESSAGDSRPREFMGLFAFQFDDKGRILDHTIESAEHSRHWSKGMGSSVVRFTDKLLGNIKQRGDPDPLPMPTCSRERGDGKG